MDIELIGQRTGKNIKELRESKNLNQEKFASDLNVSRTTVTGWEKGTLPTTPQLLKLNEVYGESIDKILGLKSEVNQMIVLDSSVLIRRPQILNELERLPFTNICLTSTVLSELNNLKDKASKSNVKQKAWLAMKSFNEHKKNDDKRYGILENSSSEERNDDKIISTAYEEALKDPNQIVYLLSDDIYFPLESSVKKNSNNNNKKISNFIPLTIKEYEDKFVKDLSNYNRDDSRVFFDAVKQKNMDKLEKVIHRKPDINYVDPASGYTPLICAIRNRDKEMVKKLVSLDVDVNKRDEYKYCFTPLAHCVQIKNIEFINILLDNGADINRVSKGENKGNSPLMVASWDGKLDIVKLLVKRGANCNLQDSNGFTALIKAIIRTPKKEKIGDQHQEIIRFLMTRTDKELRDFDDNIAKDYILKAGDIIEGDIRNEFRDNID